MFIKRGEYMPITPNTNETPQAINQKETQLVNNTISQPEAQEIQIKTQKPETSASESPAELLEDMKTIVAGTEEQLPVYERGGSKIPPGLTTEKSIAKSLSDPLISLPPIEKSFEEKFNTGDEGEAVNALVTTINNLSQHEK
jgi:hypothetical protein